LAHFLRSLVGEGDGADLAGLVARLEQTGNLVGDDAGLARAGTSQHQARTMEVVHRLQLGGIEGRRSFSHEVQCGPFAFANEKGQHVGAGLDLGAQERTRTSTMLLAST